MTPREDLEGQTPRAFLHAGRDWVERELENRQQQWTNEGEPPRPLDRDTFAYLHGPLGRHEVVLYFDLCRAIIDLAWEQLLKTPQIEEAELTALLHRGARSWLAEAQIDDDPTPPAAIIDHERRRLPLSGDYPILDHDCPLCRAAADQSFGPMFRSFDGHHLELDDEFAFSLCETRAQWEEQLAMYGEFKADAGCDPAPCDAPAREGETGEDDFNSVWSSSFVDERSTTQAGPLSAFAIIALATRMTELVSDLKSAGADRALIDRLNRDFDDYRATSDDPQLTAMATSSLVESLEAVAAAHRPLTGKVADLQSQLDQRLRRMP
jgi:hypothetical protein